MDNDPNEIPPKGITVKNYPNPFNPQTTISLELDNPGKIKIEIYNVRGQKVELLTDDYYEAGKHNILWNAEAMPSGVYFYRIITDSASVTAKMILMK